MPPDPDPARAGARPRVRASRAADPPRGASRSVCPGGAADDGRSELPSAGAREPAESGPADPVPVEARRVMLVEPTLALAPAPRPLLMVHLGRSAAIVGRVGSSVLRGRVGPGAVSIVPAGAAASFAVGAGGWDAAHLALDPAVVRGAAMRGGLTDPGAARLLARVAVRDPALERLALDLLAEAERPGWASGAATAALVDLLALHLLRRHSTAPPAVHPAAVAGDALLDRVVDRIDADLAADLSVPALAAAVGVSPDHFARVFRGLTGLTPHAFVVRRRVERARDLLRAGGRSIAEVAHAVGFADQGHLTRHFGRLLGTTPARFLREHGILQRRGAFLQDPAG